MAKALLVSVRVNIKTRQVTSVEVVGESTIDYTALARNTIQTYFTSPNGDETTLQNVDKKIREATG